MKPPINFVGREDNFPPPAPIGISTNQPVQGAAFEIDIILTIVTVKAIAEKGTGRTNPDSMILTSVPWLEHYPQEQSLVEPQ